MSKENTIFKKIIIGHLVILIIVVILGISATFWLNQLDQITQSISSIDSKIIRITNQLRDTILTQAGLEKKYVISQDKDFYNQFIETEKLIKNDLNLIKDIINTSDNKKLLEKINDLYLQYLLIVKDQKNVTENDQELQDKNKIDNDQLINQIISTLKIITETTNSDIDKKIQISGQTSSKALKLTLYTTIVAILMAIIIAFFNAKTINKPIIALMNGTKKIALGNFDEYIDISSPAEIKELADAFNVMCEQLRKLDEMKLDFISHVSHELKTPLTAIREASNLLNDTITKELTGKQKNIFNIIEEECERLIKSVNSILDLTRMDSGMMDYNIEIYPVSSIIESSVFKVKPIIETKKINIKMNIEDNLPYIRMDVMRITQVFDNLLGNALKFTDQNGYIEITAKLKKDKNQCIEISIADNGCGIPEDKINEIFIKFRKLRGQGTGLGLSIVQHMIDAHGGEIWVKSKYGAGSVFTFTLPV